MKNESKTLSAEESIDLITQMIMQAKGNAKRNNFYFLFWGWIIALANITVYVLNQLDFAHPYAAWFITIPAWIYTLYRSIRSSKENAAPTHLNTITGWLWTCFGISIFILTFFGYKMNFQLNPLILTIAAIPTFVSGVILRFKPLMCGGAAFWICGIIGFLVGIETQPLVGACAILGGYLIPGYLLKSNEAN